MNNFYENAQVFLIGALLYNGTEVLFRGFTHWTMFLAGGLCVTALYNVFLRLENIALWKKCLIGTTVITIVEFAFGCIFNLILKWDVWDYSGHSFHLWGQVCLLFTVFWFILSAPLVWLTKHLQRITRDEFYI